MMQEIHRVYSKNKTPENLARMKWSRNFATKLKNDLKKGYFNKALQDNKGNSKKIWDTINEAFGKTQCKSEPITNIRGETESAAWA